MATLRTREASSRRACHEGSSALSVKSSRQFRQLITAFIAFIAVFTVLRLARDRGHDSSFVRYNAPSMVSGAEPGPQTAEEHFSPTENLEQLDIARIRQAEHTLDIA